MLLSILYRSVCCLLGLIAVLARQDLSKDAELLVLRRENTVLRTTHWSHVRGTTRHAASPDAAPTAVAITKVALLPWMWIGEGVVCAAPGVSKAGVDDRVG
jgi:hypothetical protein